MTFYIINEMCHTYTLTISIVIPFSVIRRPSVPISPHSCLSFFSRIDTEICYHWGEILPILHDTNSA